MKPRHIATSVVAFVAFASTVGAADLKIWSVWANESSGTGTLIQGPDGTTVLYDLGGGATWANYCKEVMDANSVSTIQYTVAGHYDNDHIGSLDNLVDLTGGNSATGYSPNVGTVKFYDRGGSVGQDGEDISASYLDFVTATGRRATAKVDGTTDISLGSGATLRFLSAGAADTTNTLYVRGKANSTVSSENDLSITALVTYGGFDFYVGSDAEGVNEKAIDDVVATGLGRHVDILHVDHHGSDTNGISSPEFLGNMDPEVALISVWSNSFGHPRATTVTNLQAVVEPLPQRIIRLSPGDTAHPDWAPETMSYCHTTNGHVTIMTNGSTYTVSGNGITEPGLVNHAVDDGPEPTATPTPRGPTPTPGSPTWPVKLHVNSTTFSRTDSISVSADFQTCLTPFFPYARLIDPFGRLIYLQRAPASSTRLSWTSPARFIESGPWVLNYDLDYFPVLDISFINAAEGTWAIQGAFLDIYGNIIGGMNEKLLTVQ